MVRASLTCCLCVAVCPVHCLTATRCTCSCDAERMPYRCACMEVSAASVASFLPAHSLVSWRVVRGDCMYGVE